MAAMGNKRTYKEIPNPVKPEKKWKLNSAFIRFLKILIVINAPFLSRIVEFDNSDNDLDYIVAVIYI